MEKFSAISEELDSTLKKKPKEDPVGSFISRFGKTLDIEHTVAGEIDFSYLTPAQRAESMWAVFNNIMKTAHKLRWKEAEEKINKDEMGELKMGLGAINKLYEDEEVKKVYLDNYQRHIQESESINGDLEKFKLLKKTVSKEEKLLDDYACRVFGKRGKINEIDRLLFKTAKSKLGESRSAMTELLSSNAELRVLNQFEEIKELAKQLREEGYMWTGSRREFLEEFEDAALFGDPILIFGESGVGKTELIRAASIKLTGELCSESGGKDIRFSNLIAMRDVDSSGGFFRFGPLGKAATGKTTTLDKEKLNNGRIFLVDEFNLRAEADQIEMMAGIASWKPGRKIMMPVVDEEEEITNNFLACASVNLASEKYAGGRKDISLEVMRKFGKKLEVPFMSREEIFDAMQAALMDENSRIRAAKSEISPIFEAGEENSRFIKRDGREIKQYFQKLELKNQEQDKDGKVIMAGGFIWRLSGAIDQLNRSIAHQETVLKAKGEAQYLNKILIDVGKIIGLMKNYVLSEDKISLEQFVVKFIRKQFSEMKSFSQEDRELTKEFFANFGIDLESDKEKPLREFEIMTPRDIGLLSPRVKYEKITGEEPVLVDAVFITPEGERVEYRIESIEQGDKKFVPGQIFKISGRSYEFLGVDKTGGDPVYRSYQKKQRGEFGKENSASAVMKASWQNPETGQEQVIEINLERILDEQKAFYRNRLNLEIDEREVKSIWNKNYTEIKNEIEKYGYDKITIVPDNLPEEEILNRDIIESMEETVGNSKKKVAATYQGDNFKNGGSFAGVINSEQPKYRIVLVYSKQNIYNNPAVNPYIKATLGKDIMQLTGLDLAEIEKRISGNQEMKVEFKAMINGQEVRIESDGESLEEYILQQAMYFEKTGQHLDEKGWTWLLKSFSGSRVVYARWYPDDRRLGVSALDPDDAADSLGLRLSRSFSS